MKRYFYVFILFCLFIPLSCSPNCYKNIDVCFSPSGGCTAAIIREIDAAKYCIFIQAYSFTSAPIAAALVEAHKRGVSIQIILDKSQKKKAYSSATFLYNSGIQTYIDYTHAIAHNKIIIIDGLTVITGSFNFTKAAEKKNAENLLIIKSPDMALLYKNNWQEHQKHAENYQ